MNQKPSKTARKAVIAVSGTPGTGKTLIAKKLSLLLKMRRIDIDRYIGAHRLFTGYDQLRKTRIVPIGPLKRSLAAYIKKSERSLIIDSHLAHFLSPRIVDIVIITVCDIKTLHQRLQKRGYNQLKIRENLDAEIFDTCYTEAQEMGHTRILRVDTTRRPPIHTLAQKIRKMLD
ncbi:adenylate kinase family protein [Candidatus Woesearchaeota archaeon]|nr:adenylate kinase family protein [Candidatus Woesearchaeota archaeon]